MNYKLFISEEATLDLGEAKLWYNSKRDQLGAEFMLSVDATFEKILRNPNHFQVRYRSTKVAFIQRFPFGIHFLVEGENIYIQGVFHMSQSPKNWDDR